jgi:serine/threonine protein kinase
MDRSQSQVAQAKPDSGLASATSPPAATLAGWRLVRRVAQTPWFDVFRAAPALSEPNWPADYVVKCARQRTPHAAQAGRLLRREAEVSRAVSHEHLATVLVAQLDHVPPFIVQPCYEGHSLDRVIGAHGPMPVRGALWIARQVAEALAALHAARWRHGDVKPANVIASAMGHATLIDLGFAEQVGGRFSIGIAQSAPLQTTLAYAAPEVLSPTGEPTTASDVYSLGITLFEMLCGRTPFPESHPHELACSHTHAIPDDVRVAAPQVPSQVARLLARMLLKDPARRPDAKELVEALVKCEIECFALHA